MLVLTRKAGERIAVGKDVVITVVEIGAGRIRIGIDAPRDVPIHRGELKLEREAEGGPQP